MLALLSFLEANQHNNRYGNENDDVNALDYQKQFYGLPYGGIDTDNDGAGAAAAAANAGEWWNDWIEPSVQYYGNSPYGHFEQNPRDRHASKGIENFPITFCFSYDVFRDFPCLSISFVI